MTTLPFHAALLLMLAAPAATMQGGVAPGIPAFQGQLLFHQHIVIRIPRMPMPPPMAQPDAMPPISWEERSAPKCVAGDRLVAATIPTADRVDLMLSDGERLRAKLDKKCRALDFYAGFYVQAGRDGQVCAGRDAIHTRSGDNCPIDHFKRLVPAH